MSSWASVGAAQDTMYGESILVRPMHSADRCWRGEVLPLRATCNYWTDVTVVARVLAHSSDQNAQMRRSSDLNVNQILIRCVTEPACAWRRTCP